MKSTANIDIRSVGSGNVGGRNAFEVTGKKWLGAAIVFIDVLKGVVSVVVAQKLFANDPVLVSIAMSGVVLGHCYPVWLKFKGGRGLATAAGVFLWLSWLWVGVWLLLYFIVGKIIQNVHATSVIALVGTPLIFLAMPVKYLTYATPSFFGLNHFLAAGSFVIAVCLSRHIEPLQKLSIQDSHND